MTLPDLKRRDENTQNSISVAQERDAVITSLADERKEERPSLGCNEIRLIDHRTSVPLAS